MADFCKQCSMDTFQEDFRELAGLSTPADTAIRLYASAICEGCGYVQVDHEGICVSPDCLVDHATGNPRPEKTPAENNPPTPIDTPKIGE